MTIIAMCAVMNTIAGNANRNGGKQRTTALIVSAKLMCRFTSLW
jgi:hypothetical protein